MCTAAAREAFERGERLCRITNKRLDHFYVHPDRLDPELRVWLGRMETSIRDLVGDVREFLDKLPELVRVTAGATEDKPRLRALPFLKISGKVKAPLACGRLLRSLGTWFGAENLQTVPVEENRISLVPKNWKTHRTIACEPTGSLPVQLAVDAYLKRRLRRWGIDLHSQTMNQEMARLGSLTGAYATLDLAMASDTVSYNVVAWLLPHGWLELLQSVRASGYRGPLGEGTYAKFSSMGNGATFVLETMIFGAACKAVGCVNWSVYGDDIIVETGRVADLLRLLRFLGFLINREKSFSEGPFRESCGADWYRGVNVTPFYLRGDPKTLGDWCHLVNGLISLGFPGSQLWKLAYGLISKHRLPLVPFGDDDSTGVWIDVSTAWSRKILFSRDHTPYYVGLVEQQGKRSTRGWRSGLLWHLMARRRTAVLEESNALIGRMVGNRGLTKTRLLWRGWESPLEPCVQSRCSVGHTRRRIATKVFVVTTVEAPCFLWAFADAIPDACFSIALKYKRQAIAKRQGAAFPPKYDVSSREVQDRAFYNAR
jgi:hypothetical protein